MTTTSLAPEVASPTPDLDRVAEIARQYHDDPAQLMRYLFDIQAITANSIPRDVATVVARETGLPEAKLYGFLTFYAMFSATPRGKHLVRLCTSGSCFLNGAGEVREAICERLGVDVGGTTPDGLFTVELCQCTGTCDKSPAMMIDSTTEGPLTPAAALAFLDEIAEADKE